MNDGPLTPRIEAALQRLELALQNAKGRAPFGLLAPDTPRELTSAAEELAALRLEIAAERRHYQQALDMAPGGYLVTDLGGLIQEVNQALVAMFRASEDTLLGRPLADYLQREDAEGLHSLLAQLSEGMVGKTQEWQAWVQPPSGSPFRAVFHAAAVCEARGEPLGVRWWIRELAEEGQAAENERSGARSEGLIAVSEQVLAERTVEGVLQRVVGAARALTGARVAVAGHGYRHGVFRIGAASRAEGVPACPPGQTFVAEKGGMCWDLLEGQLSIRLGDREMREHPAWWGLPEGHVPLRGLLGVRLTGGDGRARGLILASDKAEGDFTAEDEALLVQLASLASLGLGHLEARDEAQRRAEELNAILDVAGGIMVYDAEGAPVRVSAAMSAYGLDPVKMGRDQFIRVGLVRDAQGRPVAPEDVPSARVLRGERIANERLVVRSGRDEDRILVISGAPLRREGTITGAVLSWHDITDLERARQSRDRLAAILEATPDYASTASPECQVLYINGAGRQILGIEEEVNPPGLTVANVHPEWAYAIIRDEGIPTAVREGVWRGRTALLSHNGSEIPVSQVILAHRDAQGELQYLSTIARDISEEERLSQENRDQRRFLEQLMEVAPVAIAVLRGEDHCHEYANRRYRAFLQPPGGPPLVGRTIQEVYPEAEAHRAVSLIDEVRRCRQAISLHEYQTGAGPDGERAYWNMDLVPLDGDEAEVDRVLVVGSEVTKQVAIRLELAAEQARLRAVLQNIPLGVVVVDNACRVVLANAAAEELGPLPGFSSGQSVGYLELACCPEAGGSHSPVELACIRTVQEGESYGNEEMAVPGPGGRARHLLVSAAPILDRHGRSEGGVAVFQDISERKKAQEDLRQYADRLQILHRTDQAILEAQSAEEVIAPILPCLQRLVPYKWAGVTWFDWEAGEMSMLDVYPGGGDGPGRGWRGLLQWAWFLEQLEEEGMYLAEDVHDGLPSGPLTEALEDVGVRGYAALPIAIQGKLVGALGVGLSRPGRLATDQIEILRDVANELAIGLHQVRLQQQLQRHTQELERSVARRTAALRESQARLRAIFEGAAMGIALAREDGRLVESNPALQRMLGYSAEELQGMRFAEFTHPEDVRADLDRFEELLAGERDHYQLQKRYIRKDGRTVWVNLTVSLIQFPRDLQRLAVGIVEDITEKKRAQEALIQAEKLTVTGRLAASLAHEINNPLQAVIGCMDLAERAMVEGGDVERYMQVARHELRRAARVVAQLRDLHRQPKERVREPTDVNAVMERVLTVSTQQLQRGRVQLDWCGADELPALIATPDQLEQVFLNLVLNAIDAMPRGGELQVRTARTWQPDGIAVRVADTGIGIAPDVLPQLFEPFHSTRIEGLGLGLYVSRNIVEGHGGHIDVVSEPGRGATFTVWLPLQGHPTG